MSSPSVSSRSAVQWGAYVGWEEDGIAEFERTVGSPMDFVATFVHWGNEREFPVDFARSLGGKTLLIFWEAMDYNVVGSDQAAFSYDAILRGDYDMYIRTFADQAKQYGRPVILIPFEEVNGAWYPWSGMANGNTPEQHIEAYRYVREFFRGVTNVKFGWAVNHDSDPDVPENSVAAYYPGAAYVDIVGVNGFNFADPWMSFTDIFDPALRSLKRYGKPVYIFSMASAEGPEKAAWIRDALSVEIPRHPEIRGFGWFNEKKERDWRVDSDPESLRAFQEAVND